MRLDFSRVQSVMDVERLCAAHVAVVGVGGSVTLICDLERCGVQQFTLFDFDRVEPSNVTRQDHDSTDIGFRKVAAVAERLHEVNPAVRVREIVADICELTPAEIAFHFRNVDLLIMATDSFAAQAKGNEIALMLGIPAVFVGLYQGGVGGEVAFWHPELLACFRCLCAERYAAHDAPQQPSITSDGASILDIRLVDGIAAMIAVGLLTRGAENRYGRLIDELGDRQFIQVSCSPEFRINGRDPIRGRLRVPEDELSYFAWNAVALSDPDRAQLPCPDCERYRGHRFVQTAAGWRRVTGTEPEATPSDAVSVAL